MSSTTILPTTLVDTPLSSSNSTPTPTSSSSSSSSPTMERSLGPTKVVYWEFDQCVFLNFLILCKELCTLGLWISCILFFVWFKLDYRGFVTATLAACSFDLVASFFTLLAIRKASTRWLLIAYLAQIFFLFVLFIPLLLFFISRYLIPPFPATSGFSTETNWVLLQNIAVSVVFISMLAIQMTLVALIRKYRSSLLAFKSFASSTK